LLKCLPVGERLRNGYRHAAKSGYRRHGDGDAS